MMIKTLRETQLGCDVSLSSPGAKREITHFLTFYANMNLLEE